MTQKNEQKIVEITGDEFNAKMQQKFDNTVEYIAQLLFESLNRRIATALTQQLSTDHLIIAERVGDLISREDSSEHVSSDMVKWEMAMVVTIGVTENQIIFRKAVMNKLQTLFKQWNVIVSEKDSGCYIILDSNFVPSVSINAKEMSQAWDKTYEKMVQHFIRVIMNELQKNKGKKSCNGIFRIGGVTYRDEDISMSYAEGKKLCADVKDIIHNNGFEMNLVGASNDVHAIYPNVIYDIELSTLSNS